MAEEMLDERCDRLLLRRGHGLVHFQKGRTSTEPPVWSIRHPLANSAAAPRVSACTMATPPTSSLDSTNRPSVTTFFPAALPAPRLDRAMPALAWFTSPC